MKNHPHLFPAILLCFIFGLFQQAVAQEEPHTEDDIYTPTGFTTAYFLDRGSDSLTFPDTSLEYFHLYHPVFRYNFGMGDLGGVGTPMQPLVFSLRTGTGFDLGLHYLDPYQFNIKSEQRYYHARKPLTRLFYTQGSNEFINLKAFHTQNITKNWNAGIDFNRLKSDGFYLRQKTSSYNTRVFTWYHSRDYRYHLLADGVFNSINNQESGGLLTEESFDTLSGAVRQAAVRFYGESGTVEARNRLRSNAVSLRQYYRLGRDRYFPTEATDTLGNPILDTIPTFIPSSQFMLNTGYRTYRNIFSINALDEAGYSNFFLDSLQTYDSLYNRELWGEFAFQSGRYKSGVDSFYGQQQKWSYEAGLKYQYIQTGWSGDYAAYHNTAVFGRFGFNNIYRRTKLEVGYERYLTGYNADDHLLRAFGEIPVWKLFLGADFSHKLAEPDFTSYYYFGNHYFWWNTGFGKVNTTSTSVFLRLKKDREPLLRLNSTHINNLVYYNREGVPAQHGGRLSVLSASLEKNLRYKALNFNNRIVYQTGVIDSILRLPQFAVQTGLFFQGKMFKKALLAKIGIDFFYTSEYRANIYNPNTRQFQLQDSIRVGNYPYFNIYLTGKIRTFTFYLMFQHVNQGLTPAGFYSSPLYAMEPRALRFGLQWYLYN